MCIRDSPRVQGLAEMMNFVGAINGDEQTVEKIVAAQAHHKKIDGHAPDLQGNDLNAYIAAGVYSCLLYTSWDRCRELLSAYHQKHPLHAGMPAAELRQKLFRQITPAEGDALLEVFRAEGRMKRAEDHWALAEFSIRLTKRQTALRDALLERFLRGGPEPDTVEAVLDSIPPERREEARQVLESLLTGGELVRLAPELC